MNGHRTMFQVFAVRWWLALAFAQALGALLTTLMGAWVASLSPPTGPPQAWWMWVPMLVSGWLEGTFFGLAQWWAAPALGRAWRWVVATAAGFVGGWVVAILLSEAGFEHRLTMGEEWAWTCVLGLILGISIASSQYVVLRIKARGWWAKWSVANGVGWAAGLLAATLISAFVPAGDLHASGILWQMGAGFLTGSLVAFTTRPVLR